MLMPIVVLVLQEEWRRQAALERKAELARQVRESIVPLSPPRRRWLDRALRRRLPEAAASAR